MHELLIIITTMDKKLDILKNIQEVEAPDQLYDKVLSRIQNRKPNIISLRWASTAVAVVMLFIALDIYAIYHINKDANQDEITAIAPVQDNQLYYE
ncbi:MAG: hypothetical protein GY810_19400 [Aureispira sp.]|nr:hypothetical protein [Aureispira sp.]